MKSRVILVIIAAFALTTLLLANKESLGEAVAISRQVNVLLLVGMVVGTRAISFLMLSMYYRKALSIYGTEVSLKELYQDSLAVEFLNSVLPSIGVSGSSWLILKLKEDHSVPAHVTSLIQVGRYFFNFLTFATLLFLCLILLLITNDLTIAGGTIIISLLLVTLFFDLVIWFVISGKTRVKNLTVTIVRIINLFLLIVSFGKSKESVSVKKFESNVHDFHELYQQTANKSVGKRYAFGFLMVFAITEAASVYSAFIALGQYINPAKSVVAYGTATLAASVFALVPAGLGFYESAMTYTFNALGVNGALSLSATLLYRATLFVCFLIPGIYFYSRLKKHAHND